MSEQHTPEPWEVFDLYGDPEIREKETGKLVSALRPERLKDARRIVACVNACAGIQNYELEASPHQGLLHLAEFANELVKQRDEVLAAASAVVERWDSPLWKYLPHTGEYIHRLREAIASVKGRGKTEGEG